MGRGTRGVPLPGDNPGRKTIMEQTALGLPAVREPDAKVHGLTKEQVEAMRETLGKCINPATGEATSARKEETAVLPVSGTVVPGTDGNGRGQCPHCGAHVRLSGKGYVTAHNVRHNPVPTPPPAVRLAEKQVETTDTGVRAGSPDAAMRKRGAELGAALGTDTVRIKVKVDGKSTEKDVPPTPANIRTAIRQERGRKSPDAAKLARLSAMLKGATGTKAVPVIGAQPGTYRVREAVTLDAPHAPEGREERETRTPAAPGPALVKGTSMPAKEPRRTNKHGGARNAAGWSEPLGRDRSDRIAVQGDASACKGKGCTIDGCVAIIGGRDGYMPCGKYRELSRSQARRYWEHVATNKRRREAAADRKVSAKAALEAGARRSLRQYPTATSSMQGGAAVRQA